MESNVDKQCWYPRSTLKNYSVNVISAMMFSLEYEYGSEQIQEVIRPMEKFFEGAGTGNIGDYINFCMPFYQTQLKLAGTELDTVRDYLRQVYDDHVSNLDIENPKDLFDLIIIDSEAKDKEAVVAIAMDFLLAELSDVCDGAGKIELSHRANVPYFNAIIKEVLRIRPSGPVGLPRICLEDITINGVFIPKNSRMIMNIFGLHHNEKYWDNPTLFNPDRFMSNNNHNEHYMPFSLGKRDCVGQNLAADSGLSIAPDVFALKLSKRHERA
eukprot:gene7515-8793_t